MTGLPVGGPGQLYGGHHLPYGAFVHNDRPARLGVRLGEQVLDLYAAEGAGLVQAGGALRRPLLNDFLARGLPTWQRVRDRLTGLLTGGPGGGPVAEVAGMLRPLAEVELRLPFAVADYVDFYSSEQHASNLGQILRPGQPALLPNWKQLPVGYHGRSGTVVVSGTPVVRPRGLRAAGDYGPSDRLDIEAEVGFVVGTPSRLGEPVRAADFAEHVFGMVLVNDWSARDIQAFEYQPLGPFLGKSFATSVSAWVTPLAALASAVVPGPDQDPPVAAYLRQPNRFSYDLSLCVACNGAVISCPPFAGLYWTPGQQLAHLTANGACLRTGDLFASGTVSGTRPDQFGSMLELSWGGSRPIELTDGASRTYLLDGDTVCITATAPGPHGTVIGLGEVTGTILPAR